VKDEITLQYSAKFLNIKFMKPLSYSRGVRCMPTDRRTTNGLVVLPQGFESTYKEVGRKIKDENK
jgi:hypothetical protein